MFVCPGCGWRLPACWKAHRYFLYGYYCRLDEFESFYSLEAVEFLKEKLDLHDVSCADPLTPGDWTFHLTSPRSKETSRYVILILTEFKDFVYRRDLVERHVAANTRGQSDLKKFVRAET